MRAKTSWQQLALLPVLLVLALFMACGGSDDDSVTDGGKYQDDKSVQKNANCNDVSSNPVLGRLEFPKVKGGNTVILVHRTNDSYGINYSVEWDCDKKAQRWTAYQMNKGFRGSAGYWGKFEEDPDLPVSKRLSDTYSYYRGSGFTRGHICPSADRQYSEDANRQTFYYTNMQPQYYMFNAGTTNDNGKGNYDSPWVRMEAKVRTWTNETQCDTLYVVKGGTIEDNQLLTTIGGTGGLRVPKYFFVALLMKAKAGYKAIGFWMEHDNVDHSKDKLGDYVVNIRALERLTGMDFFCNLPDDEENRVETLAVENIKAAWGLSN